MNLIDHGCLQQVIMLPYCPLKERILKVSSSSMKLCATSKHSVYRNWPEESMSSALEAVARGMSVRKAAEEYGIPKSTLWEHVSGNVLPGAHSGPPRY